MTEKEEYFKDADKFEVIDFEKDDRGSIFGNYFMVITEEQMQELRDGKVLYHPGEYGIFIALKEE